MNHLGLRLLVSGAAMMLCVVTAIHTTGVLQKPQLGSLGLAWSGFTLLLAYGFAAGAMVALFSPDEWWDGP